MMKVLAIAGTSVRRLLRDRSNIFFVFIMPMMLILILGAAFGGDYDPRVGVVIGEPGELAEELVEGLKETEGITVKDYDDRDALILAVERGQLEAGVLIPAGYDSSLEDGESVALEYVAQENESAQALRNTVESVVTEQGTILRAAAFAQAQGLGDFSTALNTARLVASSVKPVEVEQKTVGEAFIFDSLGRFELGAYSQLLLFVFLTSMTGSTALIQSRQLGVSERMISTPTPVSTILAGESIGRLAVALVQGLLIILGTALMFGVDWGDPLGAAATFLVFATGASGVGMLMGAVFKNDQQAGGIGVMVGIGLGALGGCMIPLAIMKIFSPALYRVAHITPHAWGIEAYEKLIIHGGTIADIGLELSVLSGFAVVVYGLGVWRLRVALTK